VRCPCCHRELQADNRLGVELACCRACPGVWVGGDGLSRLLERARGAPSGSGPAAAPPHPPDGRAWTQEIEFYDFG